MKEFLLRCQLTNEESSIVIRNIEEIGKDGINNDRNREKIQWIDICHDVPWAHGTKVIRINGSFVTSIKRFPDINDSTMQMIVVECQVQETGTSPKWGILDQPTSFKLLYCRDDEQEFGNKEYTWRISWSEWHNKLRESPFLKDISVFKPRLNYKEHPRLGEWYNPANPERKFDEHNNFCNKPMPWHSMGILSESTNNNAGNAIIHVCIWYIPEKNIAHDVDGALHVFLYSATQVAKENVLTAALAGMEYASLGHLSDWCFSPALLVLSLATSNISSTFTPAQWAALITWQGLEIDKGYPKVPMDFLELWNQTARFALASTKLLHGGTPLLGIPIFNIEESSESYFRSNILIDPSFTSGVRHIFPALPSTDNTIRPISVDFIWNWMDSIIGWKKNSAIKISPRSLILREGFIDAKSPSVITKQWKKKIEKKQTTSDLYFFNPYFSQQFTANPISVKKIPVVIEEFEEIVRQIASKSQNTSLKSVEQILSIFTIKFNSWDSEQKAGFRVGSLIIKPSEKTSKEKLTTEPTTKEFTALECTLRGSWSNESWDIYPEFKLTLQDCEIHTSGSNDADRDDIYTQLDVMAGDEDRLQRETSSLLYPQSVLATNAEFTLRFKSESGKNSVMEIIVKSKSKNQGSDKDNGTYFFNARPYVEAQLNSIQFDAESGARIATWRSDDPDGAQWRFGYSEMGFRLPPQAVGEEMERGNRFWTNNHTPYIEKDRPIRFRFSPPTFVTIRPGILDRRYNKNPANFREIIRNSDIEQFETEAVYPLSMKFARDQNREPEVRMTEIAEFFGRPAENLPFFDDTKIFPKFISDENLLDEYLAKWYLDKSEASLGKENYIKMRSAQSAARINFVSRLAVMHLHDPYRKDHKLFLTKGIEFRLRSRNEGAPALANPLPTGVDLNKDQKKIAENFLTKDSIDWENVESIRGGLIHTMEFPSELVAVLRGPVSRDGVIENLSFSALGASSKVSASFDNGRTTFTAEVQYGQASRIVKTRVGRIGVLWNKAQHVIVYERTTVPSLQFESEQPDKNDDLKGWPILRKTEEYIELIEDERLFEAEKSAIDNRAGAIFSSKFFTKRIYVNGSWGRDVTHGYEIPLWNKEDTNGFYPKPYAALMTYAAGEDKTRQRHEEPHQLFFYSNTEPQSGSDSNAWPAKVLVDFQPGWRFNAMARENENEAVSDAEVNRVLDASSLPNPGPQIPRNPRFDMAVLSEGPGNVQHSRGESPMLVKFSVLAIERTSLTGAATNDDLSKSGFEEARKQYENFGKLANTSMKVRSIEEEVEKFIARIDPSRMGISNLDCIAFSKKLRAESDRFFDDLKKRCSEALPISELKKLQDSIDKDAITESLTKFCEERIQLPVALLNEFVKNWALKIEGLRQMYEGRKSTKDKILEEIEGIENEIVSIKKNIIRKRFKNVCDRINDTLKNRLNDLSTSLEQIKKVLDHLVDTSTIPTKEIIDQIKSAAAEIDAKLALLSDPRLQLIAGQIRSSLARIVANLETAVEIKDKNIIKSAQQLCSAAIGVLQGAHTLIDKATMVLAAPDENLGNGGEIWSAFDATTRDYFVTPLRTLKDYIREDESENAIKEQFNLLAHNLQNSIQKIEKTLINEYEKKVVNEIIPGVEKISSVIADQLRVLVVEFYENIGKIDREASDKIDNSKEVINDVIRRNATECNKLATNVKNELSQLETWAREKVTNVVAGAIDSEARKQLESLASQAELFKNKGSQAIKLCKAIGDIPSLPHLTFNADRAEYVFDDFKKQIETSPFAMKMHEIDDGLKGLGLSISSRQLLDQFMPDPFDGIELRKICNNIAGLDCRILDREMPKIGGDHVKVSHGFDKETRSAWVKANVHFESPEESTVFGEKAVSVKMAAMSINATSDFRIGLDGRRTEQTEGVLTCDLALDLSDKRLVKFRQVTITFNNHGKYDFNIAPDKIELHPSLKFISEFAERFQGSLPPAIQIEKDEKGFPTGAKASFETRVENLPPLGAVSIGTLTIASGLNLRVDKGDFQIGTYISVGTRSTPIFVQIGFLGGGVWLEGQIKLVKGKPEYRVTCGLAIGSTRAFTLGGVARGLYSILIFADIQFESTRQHFIVGILIEGSARILGLANACVRLQLEANHSGGKSKGTGTLDVSVKISWCYTLKVRKQVTKEF